MERCRIRGSIGVFCGDGLVDQRLARQVLAHRHAGVVEDDHTPARWGAGSGSERLLGQGVDVPRDAGNHVRQGLVTPGAP